jgi:hypothetical protein
LGWIVFVFYCTLLFQPPREGHYLYSLSEMDKVAPPEVVVPNPRYVYRWEEETAAPQGILGGFAVSFIQHNKMQ